MSSRLRKIALISLALIVVIVFIFPYAFMVFSSFKQDEDIFRYAYPLTWKTIIPPRPTIQNYFAVFLHNLFRTKTLNSLICRFSTGDRYADCMFLERLCFLTLGIPRP